MVARLLHGLTEIKMSHIFPLIYNHRSSYPSINSPHADEQNRMFATRGPLDDIRNARPYLSTWATRTVAVEIRRQVAILAKDDPDDPDYHVQLRASTKFSVEVERGRVELVRVEARGTTKGSREGASGGAVKTSFFFDRGRHREQGLSRFAATQSRVDVSRGGLP